MGKMLLAMLEEEREETRMSVIDRLKHDHAILRSGIETIQSAFGPSTRAPASLDSARDRLAGGLAQDVAQKGRHEEGAPGMPGGLHKGEDAYCELQNACAMLSRELRQHIQREERLVALCSLTLGRFGSEELARFAIEHHEEAHYLKIINRLFNGRSRFSREWAHRALATAIAQLGHHTDEQESKLFPFVEQLLGTREVAGPGGELTPGCLSETMPVRV
jgi:hemerythrin-like domain-containing protein